MLNGKKWITMNCDGSWKDGVGGFAYFMKVDHFEGDLQQEPTMYSHHGGIVKCKSSLYAELYAVLYAFIDAIDRGYFRHVHYAVVNSDSTVAIDIFEQAVRHGIFVKEIFPEEDMKDHWRWIMDNVKQSIKFKYVKAHVKRNEDKRQWVNNRVDELAKKGRLQAEQFLEEEKRIQHTQAMKEKREQELRAARTAMFLDGTGSIF